MRPLPRRPPPLVWQVIAVAADGKSPGSCGHRHATKDAAVDCPWVPRPWPDHCDLLVRQVRDPGEREIEARRKR